MGKQQKNPRHPLIGTEVETGGRFPVTGYYSFVKHKDGGGEDCFVSPQVRNGMLFEKGDRVPDLVSCPHTVCWRLNSVY